MTTVEIVGIAVASAIVLLLMIALLVTGRRRRGDEPAAQPRPEQSAPAQPTEQPPAPQSEAPPQQAGSFLDEPLQDTLAGLGKAEHEPQVAEPADQEAPPLPSGRPAGPPAAARPADTLGLDWGPVGARPDETEVTGELPAQAPHEPDESEVTRELPAAAKPVAEDQPSGPKAVAPEQPGEPVAPEQPPEAPATDQAATGEAAVEPEPAPEPAAGRKVPLSDIIVTTSDKVVDLDDPEVRRMLTDLVTFEIDQAAFYRQQGQFIDAVLQLTEAEKVCKALGMEDTAQRIRQMMSDLNV